jgi:hypothetical protein
MRHLIFAAVVVILLWATWAQADRIRTQAGIGYDGKIVGMDAGGLVLEYAGGERTVPLGDIVSIRVDLYPDLEKAEEAYASGLGGGAKAAQEFAEAERLYRGLAQQELPQWLSVLVDSRMYKLYAESGRVQEALDTYLALAENQPTLVAGLKLPSPRPDDTAGNRKMLTKVEAAVKNAGDKPYAAELNQFRQQLVARDTTAPPIAQDSRAQIDPKRIATVEQGRTLLNNVVEGLTKAQDPALTTAQSHAIIEDTLSRCRGALALKPFLEFQTSVQDVVPEEGSNWCRIHLSSPLGTPQELRWRTRLNVRLEKDKALLIRKGQTAILRGKASLAEETPKDNLLPDARFTGSAGTRQYSIVLQSVTCRFLFEEDPKREIDAATEQTSNTDEIEANTSGFFGMPGTRAGSIVYVVDRSGSMTDSIDYVKFELKRSIGELGEEKEFHVIFYSSGPPVEMPMRRLVNATDRNKQMAFEFIDGVIPQGETDPSKALERAFEVKPELIYLLTDGEFDKATVGLVKRLNAAGKVKVHTIGFLYSMGEQVLKQIADQNGGQYKFVTEKDLAKLNK